MNKDKRWAIVRGSVAAAMVAGLGAGLAQAHQHGEQWALANEYPATSLPGKWKALDGRLAQNYARMRENAMTIATEITPELRERLREAGRTAVDEWTAKAGEEGRKILERR